MYVCVRVCVRVCVHMCVLIYLSIRVYLCVCTQTSIRKFDRAKAEELCELLFVFSNSVSVSLLQCLM